MSLQVFFFPSPALFSPVVPDNDGDDDTGRKNNYHLLVKYYVF